MSRVWYDVISPKQLHDQFGVYQGIWMPQMDRCWSSDDGYQVMSRIIMTKWGKVEHAVISDYSGAGVPLFRTCGNRESAKMETGVPLSGNRLRGRRGCQCGA